MTYKLLSFVLSIFVLTSLQAAIPVTVQPLEGEVYSSQLEGFDGKNALLDAKTVPLAELKAIRFPKKDLVAAEPPLAVTLGESTLLAESLTFSENQFQIQPAAGGTAKPMNSGMVQMILFQKSELGQDVDLDADWNEIQSMDLPDDQLVILRDGKLSHYFGKILEITEKAVRFEQDGEVLNVKRKHIFAVRFAPLANEEVSRETEKDPREIPLLGVLTDAAGSSLSVSALVPTEENAQITLTSGSKLTFPVSSLAALDFTSGRAVPLASLKAESLTVTPFFSMENAPESLSKFTAPQLNRSFGGRKIQLGGKEYAAGLELCSRTQIVFRLPGAFQTFRATVGIDDSVRPGGSSEVTILADEKVLFKEVLTGKDAPKLLNLDLSGARRLTILVDFAEGGSLGDYVGFGDAALEK